MESLFVEADVVSFLVKGEAEMKRSKAEVNAKEKALARLGCLSFLAIMILNLSAGTAVGAPEDFKLWKRVESKQVALEHLTKEEEIKSSTELLSKGDEESFKKFVSTYKDQPVKMVEAVVKASQESMKAGKFTDFFKAFGTNLDKVTGVDTWGKTTKGVSQEEALKRVFKRLLSGPPAEDNLKKISDKLKDAKMEEILAELFDFTAKGELALEDVKDADKTAEETNKFATKDDLKSAIDEVKELFKAKPTDTPVPTVDKQTPPAGPAAAQPTAAGAPGGIVPGFPGEVNDQALTPAEQQQCDLIAKNRKDELARLDALRDQLLATQAQIEAQSRRPGVEDFAKNDDNTLDKVLPGILDGLLKKNDNQTPFIPQTQPQQPVASGRRDRNKGVFNTPPPQTPPEEPLPPMQFGQAPQQQQPIQVGFNIPTALGQAANREAQGVLRDAEGWEASPLSKTVSLNSSRQRILYAKNMAEARQKRISAAARNAREEASEMEEQLATLSKGAEATLNSTTKQQRDQLQAQITQLQQQSTSLKANGGAQVGQDPQARQQLASQVSQLDGDLQNKQNLLNQLNQTIKREVEETGNPQIAALTKRYKQLNSTASELEGKRDAQAADAAVIADVLEQRTNLESQQYAMAQGAGGGRNVYQGSQGMTPRVAPRNTNPRSPIATQSGPTSGNGEFRKPLGSAK